MKHSTRICFNCGAELGLHKADGYYCPKNGVEETRKDEWGNYRKQEWQQTVFEDAGERKLQDAAPDLLEALLKLTGIYLREYKNEWELPDYWKEAKAAIKKTTE